MSLYVDSSAFLKRYVDEPESDVCAELLASDPRWITARHTYVEVLRDRVRAASCPTPRVTSSGPPRQNPRWRNLAMENIDVKRES